MYLSHRQEINLPHGLELKMYLFVLSSFFQILILMYIYSVSALEKDFY